MLIKKEFPLENSHGAGGSIDILAKDKLGHYVVIEIKRSDQVARAALLRSTKGIRRENIRTILLSTTWHELRVPFQEYCRVCEVPSEGFLITADANGRVSNVEPIVPSISSKPLCISRQQSIFFFTDLKNRDLALPGVIQAAQKSSLEDFIVFLVDYAGNNDRVIYRHGLYFGFSSPLNEAEPAQLAEIKKSESWNDDLDDLDENFLCALMDNIDVRSDSCEIGYPEKIAAMLEAGWLISVAERTGRYAENRDLVSDEILLNEFKKVEGGANHYFVHTSSPKYKLSWDKFKEDAARVLLGNAAWSLIFEKLLADMEKSSEDVTASVSIYNLAGIVYSLSNFMGKGESGYMPRFNMIMSTSTEVVQYMGAMVWLGHNVNIDAEAWIDASCYSTISYFTRHHFGEQFECDEQLCDQLDLASIMLKISNPGAIDERA